MLASLDSRDIADIQAYDRADPPDFWLQTIAGLIHWLGCLWLARGTKPPRLDIFFPRTIADDLRESRPQTSAEMRSALGGR